MEKLLFSSDVESKIAGLFILTKMIRISRSTSNKILSKIVKDRKMVLLIAQMILTVTDSTDEDKRIARRTALNLLSVLFSSNKDDNKDNNTNIEINNLLWKNSNSKYIVNALISTLADNYESESILKLIGMSLSKHMIESYYLKIILNASLKLTNKEDLLKILSIINDISNAKLSSEKQEKFTLQKDEEEKLRSLIIMCFEKFNTKKVKQNKDNVFIVLKEILNSFNTNWTIENDKKVEKNNGAFATYIFIATITELQMLCGKLAKSTEDNDNDNGEDDSIILCFACCDLLDLYLYYLIGNEEENQDELGIWSLLPSSAIINFKRLIIDLNNTNTEFAMLLSDKHHSDCDHVIQRIKETVTSFGI